MIVNSNCTSSAWYNDKQNPNPKKFTYQYTSYIPKQYRSNIKPNKQVSILDPNQKNTKLIGKLILLSSNIGELVLDPFYSSVLVGMTASRVSRKFLGYELSREYYKIANIRLNHEAKNKKLLLL